MKIIVISVCAAPAPIASFRIAPASVEPDCLSIISNRRHRPGRMTEANGVPLFMSTTKAARAAAAQACHLTVIVIFFE
jgi:hypothetical protein